MGLHGSVRGKGRAAPTYLDPQCGYRQKRRLAHRVSAWPCCGLAGARQQHAALNRLALGLARIGSHSIETAPLTAEEYVPVLGACSTIRFLSDPARWPPVAGVPQALCAWRRRFAPAFLRPLTTPQADCTISPIPARLCPTNSSPEVGDLTTALPDVFSGAAQPAGFQPGSVGFLTSPNRAWPPVSDPARCAGRPAGGWRGAPRGRGGCSARCGRAARHAPDRYFTATIAKH